LISAASILYKAAMCCRLVAALMLTIAACSDGSDPDVDRSTCERLCDHLIDVRLKDAPAADVVAHRAAMKQVLGENFITSCLKDLSPSQVKCALAATDHAAATACGAQ
jgi:hypothetical protein